MFRRQALYTPCVPLQRGATTPNGPRVTQSSPAAGCARKDAGARWGAGLLAPQVEFADWFLVGNTGIQSLQNPYILCSNIFLYSLLRTSKFEAWI